MKRIIQQAWNTKLAKISALLLVSFLIMVLTFGGCAIVKSIQPTIQNKTQVTNGTVVTPFQISKLLIYPERGYPGQEVVILAAVANTSGSEGEYFAELKINNFIEEQKKVALLAKEAQVVNFSTFRYEPGTYTVSLGGLTGQFEVLDQPAVTGPSPSTGCTGCGQAGGGCTGCGGSISNSPAARVQIPPGSCGCGGG